MSNYLPHETTICNDIDPPWINKDIKQLILDKHHAYKSYIGSDKSLKFFNQFQFPQTKLKFLIEEPKNRYYTHLSHKLLDPKASQKLYWSILKTCLNNKKIPCILPLLHPDIFVTEFKEKAKIFKNFFADQCSIVRNNSELQATLTHTKKNMRILNPNKAHRHDMISIRMIKI